MVADAIATRKMFHPFVTTWQMLLPYDIVVDVKTTQAVCYNSCLAGVICQVADGIATVGWMCMVDVNTHWHMEQPRVCSIYKFCSVKQNLILNMWQMEFAYVSVKGWIVGPYKQCFFYCSIEVLVLPLLY